MIYLLTVSFIWAFSFGLIKGQLAGVDAVFSSMVRMLLALLVFLPFLKINRVDKKGALKLIAIGGIQFGLMYIFYFYSFQFLPAHEVALFTIFTPLYVTLFNDLLTKRFHSLSLLVAFLAVVGLAVVIYRDVSGISFRTGFFLVQASNLAFASGQVLYKREINRRKETRDRDIFAWLYLGGFLVTAVAAVFSTAGRIPQLTGMQGITLLYLGVLASGVGFFWWNRGAAVTRVGTLAVFNNLKIPLAVACSLVFFGETADIPRLLLGGGIIMAAVFINEKFNQKDGIKAQGI